VLWLMVVLAVITTWQIDRARPASQLIVERANREVQNYGDYP
jgi:hypothetical protein